MASRGLRSSLGAQRPQFSFKHTRTPLLQQTTRPMCLIFICVALDPGPALPSFLLLLPECLLLPQVPGSCVHDCVLPVSLAGDYFRILAIFFPPARKAVSVHEWNTNQLPVLALARL